MADHDEEALLREELDLDYEVDEEVPEEELLGDDEEFVLSGEENYSGDRIVGVEESESAVPNLEHEEDVLDLGVTDSAIDELDEEPFRANHMVHHDVDDFPEGGTERHEQRERFRTERPNNSGHKPIVFNSNDLENEETDLNNFKKFTTNKFRGNNNRGRGRGGGAQFKTWQSNRGNFNVVNNNRGGYIHSRLGQRLVHGSHNVNQIPPLESKKVLINPHFRGNVQPSQDARLVWDQGGPPPPFHPNFNNGSGFPQNNMMHPPPQHQQQPIHQHQPPPQQPIGYGTGSGQWNMPPQGNFMQPVEHNFNQQPHLPIPVVTIQNVPTQQDGYRNDIPQFEPINNQLGPMFLNNTQVVQQTPPPQFPPPHPQQNFEYPTQNDWYNTDNDNVSNITYNTESEQYFKIPTQSGFRGRGHHRGGARFTNPINQHTLRAIPTDFHVQGNMNRGGRATFHNRGNRGNKFQPRQAPPNQQYAPQPGPPFPTQQQEVYFDTNSLVPNQNVLTMNAPINPPQNNVFPQPQYMPMQQPQFQNQLQYNQMIVQAEPHQYIPPNPMTNFQANQQPYNIQQNTFKPTRPQHSRPGVKRPFNNPNRQVTATVHPNNAQPPRIFNQNQKRTPIKRTTSLVNNEASAKRKKSLDFRNLQEVPTIDVPDTTVFLEDKSVNNVPMEDEDEETRTYRLKIEEQKRLRQMVLKQKAERRKKAAAIADSSTISESSTAPKSLSENAITSTPNVRANYNQNKKTLFQRRIQQSKMLNKQVPERTLVQLQSSNDVMQVQPSKLQASPNRKPALIPRNTNIPSQSTNLRNPTTTCPVGTSTTVPEVMPNTVSSTQVIKPLIITQRVVRTIPRQAVVQTSDEMSESDDAIDKNHLSSFLSTRTVVPKPLTNGTVASVSKGQVPLLKTPTVRVSNLAASTTEMKLRKLCKGVGLVQSVQMTPNSGQATIRFKNVSHAHNFCKKYQRKMVDLSLIDVALVPGP